MPVVKFFREGLTCEAAVGENLREVALRAGVSIYRSFHVLTNCRGRGKCGSCRVELASATAVTPAERTPAEKHHLDAKFSDLTTRLSCQVCVQEDASVLTQEPKRRGKVDTRSFIPRGF